MRPAIPLRKAGPPGIFTMMVNTFLSISITKILLIKCLTQAKYSGKPCRHKLQQQLPLLLRWWSDDENPMAMSAAEQQQAEQQFMANLRITTM
jgi:hypothetical protein